MRNYLLAALFLICTTAQSSDLIEQQARVENGVATCQVPYKFRGTMHLHCYTLAILQSPVVTVASGHIEVSAEVVQVYQKPIGVHVVLRSKRTARGTATITIFDAARTTP